MGDMCSERTSKITVGMRRYHFAELKIVGPTGPEMNRKYYVRQRYCRAVVMKKKMLLTLRELH